MNLFEVGDIVQIRDGVIGIVEKRHPASRYNPYQYYDVKFVHQKEIYHRRWAEIYLKKRENLSQKTFYVWLKYGLI